MRTKISAVIAAALFALTAVPPALAHDPSLHKGKPVAGEVASIAKNTISLKTDSGMMKVTFDRGTRFEHGDHQSSAEEIREGMRVTVFGTKLPGGAIVAREVVLDAGPTEPHEGAASDERGHAHDGHGHR
ncbi:DUF5666 domain-containing protein [Tautonia sociabilis]|uniref:DUF5666 domain-containing protein n=1 Tax=Tautonia sociabilis TaxID=2080755 RepID=A0A432ME95_9BACT|nr:DUF5666 domain-containing protein [Tautonia sociabilis]RUL83565.1 hypothetical protein TsocGM_21920 [Tautonia sociabilis]